MTADDKKLEIAARIADGSAIDWPAAADTAGDDVVGELKTIAALARLHRRPVDSLVEPEAEVSRWGPLAILGAIGEGRFGKVFRAWDARLQRQVALKILHASVPEASASPSHAIDEARLLAKVRHPNVLTIYGAEAIEGQVGIWTEFIEGRTLEEVLAERGPLPADEVAAIGGDLCRALTAVHDAGLLHRDIKAQNVMRETGGRIVLMDFGTGHDLELVPPRAGDMSGTPLYLAPEIFAAGTATVASDIYALAVLLHRLLTGRYPVEGLTLDDVRAEHVAGRRTFQNRATTDLTATIERGLSVDPSRRFQSADEMRHTLAPSTEVVRTPTPPVGAPGRRLQWSAILLAALLSVVILGTWWAVSGRAPGSSTAQSGVQETVLVAAFDNRTGDRSLDGSLEWALASELSQSPYVAVASTRRRDDLLRVMGRGRDTVVDRAVAREMAQRDGHIRSVLAGTVDGSSGIYVLTVEAIDPVNARRLHSVAERANSTAAILPAVRRLATRLRSTLGEPKASLGQVLRNPAITTTTSLQAHRLYSQAVEAGSRGGWAQSELLVRSAMELDPDYASAINWLGWSLFHQKKPREICLPYFERAFSSLEDDPRP